MSSVSDLQWRVRREEHTISIEMSHDLSNQQFCRCVSGNQHKFMQFIQKQQFRLCSNGTRPQEAVNVEDDELLKTVPVQPSREPATKPYKHAPDVGRQFKFSELSVQLAGPNQLQPKPEADNLKFGKSFTDHMIKIAYNRHLGGWQRPEITPMENLVLHPAAKVFHYAVELFEGMKAYRGVDGRIRFFRPDKNMARMNLTAERCGLPTFEGDELIKCMGRLIACDEEWVPHTEAASLYIRPTLIGIEPSLGVDSSEQALLFVILSPVSSYFSKDEAKSGGISLLADPAYTRAWPGGVGDRKMGSNYGPTVHVQRKAVQMGLNQVLWLYGPDHQLTEVGTMNIFMFFINDQGEPELRTPPLNGLILSGVTRMSILELTKQWGKFNVSEDIITMGQIKDLLDNGRMLELFGCGTACIVTPFNRIHYEDEDLHLPTLENENAVWRKILKTLTDIQYGHIDHPWAVTID